MLILGLSLFHFKRLFKNSDFMVLPAFISIALTEEELSAMQSIS